MDKKEKARQQVRDAVLACKEAEVDTLVAWVEGDSHVTVDHSCENYNMMILLSGWVRVVSNKLVFDGVMQNQDLEA